jgi:hypothetical protein
MATTARRGLSSVFDEMLTKNKSSFDDLYRRGAMPGTGTTEWLEATAPPSRLRAATSDVDPASEAARRLNERFGDDWRYEIIDPRRDGDEAIVLCKLTFGIDGSVRTQFGRAKISEEPLIGVSDGVQFRLAAGGAAQDEREAFRRAAEAALMNCTDLL